MNAAQLLALLRERDRRRLETRRLAPWELQTLLWTLGYTDELADEREIAAAAAIARTDWAGAAA